MKINEDGSMEGTTFTEKYGGGYKGPVPSPDDNETYREYRKRVDAAKAEGFHLGDLGFHEWSCYCKGSGQYDGVDADSTIGDY